MQQNNQAYLKKYQEISKLLKNSTKYQTLMHHQSKNQFKNTVSASYLF